MRTAIRSLFGFGFFILLSTFLYQGSAFATDTDGDGMEDDYETEYGLDPSDSSDAAIDTDGDGLTNLQEHTYGFDASDPAEALYLLVPYEYATIGDAVAAASDGSIIKIALGTYYENISTTLNGTIYLVGADWGDTVIDGSSAGTVISATDTATSLVLKNLTIQNGYAYGGPTSLYGGGVLSYGDLFVDRVAFDSNRAEVNGGAIFEDNSSGTNYTVISNSTFTNNSAQFGGAIYFYSSSQSVVFQSSFSDNFASYGDGGAIYLSSPSGIVVLKNSFEANSADHGGAIGQYTGDSVNFVENYFNNNSASYSGSAVYVDSAGTDEFLRNVFINNNSFAALWFQYVGYFDFYNNLFIANDHAIFSRESGDINFFNNNFIDNTGYTGGGTGADYYTIHSSGTFYNNIIYMSAYEVTSGMQAIILLSASLTCSYNSTYSPAFSGTEDSAYYASLGITTCTDSVLSDPAWTTFSDDDDYTNDDFTLSATSPLIDAGNPDSAYNDTDGSANDIGITGGPYAGDYYMSQAALEASYTDAFEAEYLSGDVDGDGVTATNGDCDDTSASVNPGELEIFGNGVDDDCDGTVDEGTDGDGDGSMWDIFGGDDCDDSDSSISPAASEYCDSIDNDCDGTVDENDAVDATTWYEDSDGDGYGDPTISTVTCSAPSGYVSDNTDCDDSNVRINPRMRDCQSFIIKRPGLPDVTRPGDGIDNNCDGSVDEGRPCIRRLGAL